MKSSLSLLPLLPFVGAIQHPFGLLDDLLATPQYNVVYSEDYIIDDGSQLLSGLRRAQSDEPTSPQISSSDSTGADSSLTFPNNPPPENGRAHNASRSVREIMVKNGQKYLCDIPIVSSTDNHHSDPPNPEAERQEAIRATAHGLELLKGMEGNCIYLLDVWWAYQFCFNQEIRQFRPLSPERGLPVYPPVPDPMYDSFILGRYPRSTRDKSNAKASTSIKSKGESRYLTQHLTGGTLCDVSGRERDIEVQIQCSAQATSDKIVMLKEVSICSYLMIIYTPRLCDDEAFLPPNTNNPNSIVCNPVIEPHMIAAWEAQQSQSATRLLDGGSKVPDEAESVDVAPNGKLKLGQLGMGVPGKQMVGGIAVGGKKVVGMPGKVIEKSAIVGGKQVVTVVADSSGFVLSQEDMKHLQVTNAREIDAMKKSLEKMAGGQDWRLELIQTPHRKEFRGILIDSEEKPEEKGKEADETPADEVDHQAATPKKKPSKGGLKPNRKGSQGSGDKDKKKDKSSSLKLNRPEAGADQDQGRDEL